MLSHFLVQRVLPWICRSTYKCMFKITTRKVVFLIWSDTRVSTLSSCLFVGLWGDFSLALYFSTRHCTFFWDSSGCQQGMSMLWRSRWNWRGGRGPGWALERARPTWFSREGPPDASTHTRFGHSWGKSTGLESSTPSLATAAPRRDAAPTSWTPAHGTIMHQESLANRKCWLRH